MLHLIFQLVIWERLIFLMFVRWWFIYFLWTPHLSDDWVSLVFFPLHMARQLSADCALVLRWTVASSFLGSSLGYAHRTFRGDSAALFLFSDFGRYAISWWFRVFFLLLSWLETWPIMPSVLPSLILFSGWIHLLMGYVFHFQFETGIPMDGVLGYVVFTFLAGRTWFPDGRAHFRIDTEYNWWIWQGTMDDEGVIFWVFPVYAELMLLGIFPHKVTRDHVDDHLYLQSTRWGLGLSFSGAPIFGFELSISGIAIFRKVFS